MRERPTVARINGVLFLHGGISPETAALGCEGINAAIAKELAALPPPEQAASLMAASETGPLWYRGLALQKEEEIAPILPGILDQMNARAIVIGHSTVLPGRIVARLDGRIILIDTGMVGGEFYKGGVPSALEWQWRHAHGDLSRSPRAALRARAAGCRALGDTLIALTSLRSRTRPRLRRPWRPLLEDLDDPVAPMEDGLPLAFQQRIADCFRDGLFRQSFEARQQPPIDARQSSGLSKSLPRRNARV